MTLTLIFLAVLVPIFISVMFIPYWTRKTESFGIAIPEEAYRQEKLRGMRKKYTWLTGILSLLTAAVLIILMPNYQEDDQIMGIVFACTIAIYMILTFIVYLYFHGQMKNLKAQNPDWTKKAQLVTVSIGFRQSKLVYSHLWYVIGFLIAIVMIVLSLMKYEEIPEKFATHFDLQGNPDGWSDKSYGSVLMMPIMQIYMTAIFLFVNIIIAKAKQQINAANAEKAMQQNIIFRRRWSLFMILMGNGLVALFSLPQLAMFYDISVQWSAWVIIGFSALSVIGCILLSITTGQGGSRVKFKDHADGTTGKIDRDDDRYWKLGMFYFNRNDPSIFLEKRFGVGWTNNWAHPLSWIFLIVILGLAALLPFLLT